MKDKHITSIMTRDTWYVIKSNLHFVDNTQVYFEDKIAKVSRPFVEQLQKKKFRYFLKKKSDIN